MSTSHAPPIVPGSTLAQLGRSGLAPVAYLGGLVILLSKGCRALIRPQEAAPPLLRTLTGHWTWMLGMGLPLVALVHMGIGSFLAMQAYYGATFVQAVGPVVGVGLVRNVAPLMAGLLFAGLLAVRMTPELRGRSRLGLDDDPRWIPDRDVVQGRQPDPRTMPEPARLAATRLLAAAMVGPVLALWGAVVGTLVGLGLACTYLGVTREMFFSKFLEMLWFRDAVGLIGKGMAFASIAAMLACHEGLRGPGDPSSVRMAAFRAVFLSCLAILLLNSAWFLLIYQAGPPFGPTVLVPPNR